MHWDRLFEDLEGQLAAEWEAERAVLDAESERLRIARLSLRTRLRVLELRGAPLTLRLVDGERRSVLLQAVGADWIAVQLQDAPTAMIVPLAALTSVETHHGALLETLEDSPLPSDGLRDRMTLGFLLRDLARRRIPLHIALRDGETLHGTIDRAGSDHLDLAVHDAGEARRAAAVRTFRIVPFDALVWARTDSTAI
ncbi:hypothetical protein [Microbacterium sp. A84]|uniref:hypothetical protein n=1 Tax=Microbacterium sp. A84 TaxID=3450715 RepID=UPI003F434FFF